MKKKRITAAYTPLRVSATIAVEGGSPLRQVFDRGAGAFIPDRRIAPLVLRPMVSVCNPDDNEGAMPSGDASAHLVDMVWYETINGVAKMLDAQTIASDTFILGGNTYHTYEVASDGTLTIRRNTDSAYAATYRFSAKVEDARQQGIFCEVVASKLSTTVTVEGMPELLLDAPERVFYNPARDSVTTVQVHATLKIGSADVPAANRKYKWEVRQMAESAWQLLGSDILHYYADIIDSGSGVAVDLERMGYGFALRCTAAYNPDGAATDDYFIEASPQKTVYFVRRIPEYDYDIADIPGTVPPGQSVIVPTALVWDKDGAIPNPARVFGLRWLAAKNTSGQSYSDVGYGEKPQISTSKMDAQKGMNLALEVEDMGPLLAWQDSDGKILTDGNGLILLIK